MHKPEGEVLGVTPLLSHAKKLLSEPNCEASSGKSTALSQDSDVEEKRASFKDPKGSCSSSCSLFWAAFRKAETTQDIVHKGPVCRQQAELTEPPLGGNMMVLGKRGCHHSSFMVALQSSEIWTMLKWFWVLPRGRVAQISFYSCERLHQCLAFIHQPELMI